MYSCSCCPSSLERSRRLPREIADSALREKWTCSARLKTCDGKRFVILRREALDEHVTERVDHAIRDIREPNFYSLADDDGC